MMIADRALLPAALLALLVAAIAPAAAQTDEPPMEELMIADGDSGSVWTPAEATMEPDDVHARAGRAMHFHIDVNHSTGQPDYPIGWPRAYTTIPEGQRDWTDWDFIDFWLYADTSREGLPGSPLGFIVRCPDKANSFSATLSQADKGEWVHFRFPISALPSAADCTAIQFFISESNYRDGDVLDFWIDDLKLLRYAEPTIIRLQPLNQVLYADQPVLRVAVEMTGLEDAATAQVEVALVRDDETVQQASAPLAAGVTTIPLSVEGGATAGEYQVQARVVGSDRTVTKTVRVVSSPWEGEAR